MARGWGINSWDTSALLFSLGAPRIRNAQLQAEVSHTLWTTLCISMEVSLLLTYLVLHICRPPNQQPRLISWSTLPGMSKIALATGVSGSGFLGDSG